MFVLWLQSCSFNVCWATFFGLFCEKKNEAARFFHMNVLIAQLNFISEKAKLSKLAQLILMLVFWM